MDIDNDEVEKKKKAYNKYIKQLAMDNGVSDGVVRLLMSVDEMYANLEQLLLQIEDEAGTTDLVNADGHTFYELAWDYASEHGCMPVEELICILGQFHGRASKDD